MSYAGSSGSRISILYRHKNPKRVFPNKDLSIPHGPMADKDILNSRNTCVSDETAVIEYFTSGFYLGVGTAAAAELVYRPSKTKRLYRRVTLVYIIMIGANCSHKYRLGKKKPPRYIFTGYAV